MKDKVNLDLVLEMQRDIERLGYDEYLRLLSHALMGLSESADKMNKREVSERWEGRSAMVDELIANDVKRFTQHIGGLVGLRGIDIKKDGWPFFKNK